MNCLYGWKGSKVYPLGVMEPTTSSRPLSQLERLPASLFYKIIIDYATFEDLKSVRLLSPGISSFLNSEKSKFMWSFFHKKLEADNPNVQNLDKLGSGPLLGLPEYQEEVSLELLKRRISILDRAIFIAGLSADGGSTILTLPAGWSGTDFRTLIRKTRRGGIERSRLLLTSSSGRELSKTSITDLPPAKPLSH